MGSNPTPFTGAAEFRSVRNFSDSVGKGSVVPTAASRTELMEVDNGSPGRSRERRFEALSLPHVVVAQMVEQAVEARCVRGSSPLIDTCLWVERIWVILGRNNWQYTIVRRWGCPFESDLRNLPQAPIFTTYPQHFLRTTMDEMPIFVLRADDRAAPMALHAYAEAASMYGKSYEETTRIRELAADFVRWRNRNEER